MDTEKELAQLHKMAKELDALRLRHKRQKSASVIARNYTHTVNALSALMHILAQRQHYAQEQDEA